MSGERAMEGFFLTATPEQKCDLVNRIEAGSAEAESELIEHYGRAIRLILLKRTGRAQLANDLCQDTFVVVLRKLRAGDLRKPSSLSAFIRQTAVNISIDHFRREKRYVRHDDRAIFQHQSHRDHKARSIDSRTMRVAIDDALEQLRIPRDREILRRFYLVDQDKIRICTDLRLSATHFDRVLYRAKQRMRRLIKRQEGLKSLLL
jgi:RNA polymerase sigma-70 factor (ECF subfamily)